jgi:hypothetical protein
LHRQMRLRPSNEWKGVSCAGCAGYIVSIPGKRVLYFGRDAETHTECLPGTAANEAIAHAS